jgi:ESCRT-I complex subunit VPS28
MAGAPHAAAGGAGAGAAGGGFPALDEFTEMRLYDSVAEKARGSDMEELFSIFVATEALETAYIADAVPPEAYRPLATNLIAKSKHLAEALGWGPDDVERFLDAYGIRGLLKAHRRLVIDRVDATAVHGRPGGGGDDNLGVEAHQTTGALITALDTIKVMSAVDEILGVLRNACDRLNDATLAPADWPTRARLVGWLRTVSGMRASEVLSEEDRRQIASDLETAHDEYAKMLTRPRK